MLLLWLNSELCILTGLQIARDNNYSELIIECDSTTAVTMIQHSALNHPTFGRVVKRITHLLNQHCYREGKKLADSMAIWDLNQNFGLHSWTLPAHAFFLIYFCDVITGVSTCHCTVSGV